jgi:hypothetical protein
LQVSGKTVPDRTVEERIAGNQGIVKLECNRIVRMPRRMQNAYSGALKLEKPVFAQGVVIQITGVRTLQETLVADGVVSVGVCIGYKFQIESLVGKKHKDRFDRPAVDGDRQFLSVNKVTQIIR